MTRTASKAIRAKESGFGKRKAPENHLGRLPVFLSIRNGRDYKRLLAEAEDAKKQAAERMQYLRKKQEEDAARRRPGGIEWKFAICPLRQLI
jgi:hypothetical protein